MDRLTARGPEGNAYYPKCFEGECLGMESREECEKCQITFDICERLAAYEDFGVMPEQLREIDKSYQEKCEDVKKLELALFATIKNCKVGPVGIAMGKSLKEINDMSKETMKEVMKMCDFESLSKQFYD